MELTEIQQRLEKLPKELLKKGKKLAIKKAHYKNLDEMTKVVLSTQMINANQIYKNSGQKTPAEWKVRAIAYGSPEYKVHLDGLKVAEEKFLRTQAHYNKLQVEFECIRSLSSIVKQQMKL